MEIKNAKISSTSIGFDDRGPSFWIHVDYGGAGQGFGGYRLGSGFTDYVLFGILKAVGCEKWENLKGKPVRVKINDSGTIQSIGHYLEDKWFDPGEYNDK